MPYQSRFTVVPISEVPTEVRTPVNSIKFGNLEAVLTSDKSSVDGSSGPLKRGAIKYEIHGLPHGQKAWIVQENDSHQLIRQTHGEAEWLGKYLTTEEALRALASKGP